jgi:hypothetical protein
MGAFGCCGERSGQSLAGRLPFGEAQKAWINLRPLLDILS